MFFRSAVCVVSGLLTSAGFSFAEDDWEPYRRTGLFSSEPSGRWLAPDMRKETVEAFTSRLLDGARGGDARAMATLGRFFFVRGDADRAGEWLRKAALAGHVGAQLDYGTLRARGQGSELAEAYQWLWLATWSKEPGAEAALRDLSPKLQAWQIVAGVHWAADYQAAQAKAAGTGTGR